MAASVANCFPNGRYDEACDSKECACRGRHWLTGSGIVETTARVLASKRPRVVLGSSPRPIVARLEDVQDFADLAVETHGRIDVVVNNAGVMPLSKLEELKIDEWNSPAASPTRRLQVPFRPCVKLVTRALRPVYPRERIIEYRFFNNEGQKKTIALKLLEQHILALADDSA